MADKKAVLVGITPGPTTEVKCNICQGPLAVSATRMDAMAAEHGGKECLLIVHHHCFMDFFTKNLQASRDERTRDAERVVLPVRIDGDPGDHDHQYGQPHN